MIKNFFAALMMLACAALVMEVNTDDIMGYYAFELDGASYTLTKAKGKSYTLATMGEAGLASLMAYDAFDSADSALVSGYDFRRASELAINEGADSFEVDGVSYAIADEDGTALIYRADDRDNPVAMVSGVIVNSVNNGVFLPVDYKAAVAEAISGKIKPCYMK